MNEKQQLDELESMRHSAGEKMDEIRSQLNRIYDLEIQRNLENRTALSNWHNWLGAIAFTLSGISGTALMHNSSSNIWAVLATVIFFIIGCWVAIFNKNNAEKSILTKSIYPEFMKLFDKQKKSAYDAHIDPTKVGNSQQEIDKSQIRIMNLSIKDATEQINELKKNKISYLNDIWTILLFIGIYLLLIPSLINIYQIFVSYGPMMVMIFVSIPVLFVLLIVRGALQQRKQILESYKAMISEHKYQIKKYKEYKKYLKSVITKRQDLINTGD